MAVSYQDDRRAPSADRARAQVAHCDLARPTSSARPRIDSFEQAEPAAPAGQPGHARRRDRRRHHDGAVPRRALRQPHRARSSSPPPISVWLWFTVLFANFAEAMAEGRGKAQANTLRAMQPRHDGQARSATAGSKRSSRSAAAQGRRRPRRGRRDHPRRRRRHRGRRLRQRGGDHRRVRAGAQGARHRHPQLRHRRHDRHQRLAAHPHHGQPGRDLPRPHDRAGRRRRAPEDAERDRAEHPAGRRSRSSSCWPSARSGRSSTTWAATSRRRRWSRCSSA